MIACAWVPIWKLERLAKILEDDDRGLTAELRYLASQRPEVHEIVECTREVLSGELGDMACLGSHNPYEHDLGRLKEALRRYDAEVKRIAGA